MMFTSPPTAAAGAEPTVLFSGLSVYLHPRPIEIAAVSNLSVTVRPQLPYIISDFIYFPPPWPAKSFSDR